MTPLITRECISADSHDAVYIATKNNGLVKSRRLRDSFAELYGDGEITVADSGVIYVDGKRVDFVTAELWSK